MTHYSDPTPSSADPPSSDPAPSSGTAAQLSAFLDGELPERETEFLLKRLGADAELRGRAGRYLLIGEAARQSTAQVARGASKDFAARVSAALADLSPEIAQSTQFAETKSLDRVADRAQTLVPTAGEIQGRAGSSWLRRSAGFAAAASVGALAVLIWQGTQVPQEVLLADRPANGAEAMNAGGMASAERGLPAETEISASLSGSPSGEQQAAAAGSTSAEAGMSRSLRNSRLTNYVMAHSEYSSPLGRRTMLSGILAADGENQELRDVAYVEQAEVGRAGRRPEEMPQDTGEQYR